jgi:hypothetical protein
MRAVDRARPLALVIALVASPSLARAQSADAEALFREGKRLLKQGKLAEGCDKIAASERMETSVGTLLNLGDCREKLGQLASAWAAFREAEAMAKRAGNDEKRLAEARRRALAIEPKLPTLEVHVAQRIPGMTVKRGDDTIDAGAWNTAVPVDPGNYTIVVEAPGKKPWRTQVVVDMRTTRRAVVNVPVLEAAPAPVVATPPPPAETTVRVEQPTTTKRIVPTWSTTRGVAVAVLVVGAGALGAGAYFGVHARDLADRSDERCPEVMCGDPEALRLNERARTSATRANIAFGTAAVAAAGATVLWFLGKPDAETVVSPTVSGGVGVSISGRL